LPASYHINREDEFISLRLEGRVDLVQIFELCQSILADPGFSPHWPQLADLRGVEMMLKPGAMKPFANYVRMKFRPQCPDAKIAVVIDADRDADFCAGAYRLTCSLGSNAELFEDYAGAMKWLLRNGWLQTGHPATDPGSLEPPDSRRHGGDEHPKQVRT